MLNYLLQTYIEEDGRITKDWSKLSTININSPIVDVDGEISHIKTFKIETLNEGGTIPFHVIVERQAWILDIILSFNDVPKKVITNNINLMTYENMIKHLTPTIFSERIVECVYKVIDFDEDGSFSMDLSNSPQWYEYLNEISKRMDISIKNTNDEEDSDVHRVHQILDLLAFDIIRNNRFGFVTDVYPEIDLNRMGLVSTASAILRYAAGEDILEQIPPGNIDYISLALESILDGTEDCSDIIKSAAFIHTHILGMIKEFEEQHVAPNTEITINISTTIEDDPNE